MNDVWLADSAELSGYAVWQHPKVWDIRVNEGDSVTIGVYVKAGNGSWGTIDDFLLNPQKGDAPPADDNPSI